MLPQILSSYLLDCMYLNSSQLQIQKTTEIQFLYSKKKRTTPITLLLVNLRTTVLTHIECILSGIPEVPCILPTEFVNPKQGWTALEKFGSVKVALLCRLPAKQHITEEKMAARLSQLHISSDYTAHQSEQREDHQQQVKRLVLCDELRQLKPEPILPSSLLSRLWVNLFAVELESPVHPVGHYRNISWVCLSVNF
jgi:hypothetical protein